MINIMKNIAFFFYDGPECNKDSGQYFLYLSKRESFAVDNLYARVTRDEILVFVIINCKE